MNFIKSFCGSCKLAGHLLADFFRLIHGVWKLSKLNPPVVSVFGGSKLQQEHSYAVKAGELSKKLMSKGISVITGGGPGIMEAANCGAFNQAERRGKSIGITVHGLLAEKPNTCIDESIQTHYFFARKHLLTHFATAFAIFPGGYGTMDELFEILTLMQTHKLKRVPVVLFEKKYWQPLIDWVQVAQKEGLLLKEDADLIFITDSVDEAFDHLQHHCQ